MDVCMYKLMEYISTLKHLRKRWTDCERFCEYLKSGFFKKEFGNVKKFLN